MPLTLILAESALELVPRELWDHPSVASQARRKGRGPGEMLLDRSYHHAAMLASRSTDFSRRGRPDIIHVSLLLALDTPLNREGRLRIFVHTLNDDVINVSPKVRIPKNYVRFVGLMEQLLAEGRVPSEGEPLLSVQRMPFDRLLDSVGPTLRMGFSSAGEPVDIAEIGKVLAAAANPAVVVGGFPRGSLSEDVIRHLDKLVSIHKEGLETWTVVARVLCSVEEALGSPG